MLVWSRVEWTPKLQAGVSATQTGSAASVFIMREAKRQKKMSTEEAKKIKIESTSKRKEHMSE